MRKNRAYFEIYQFWNTWFRIELGRSPENLNVPIAREQDVAKIEETDKMKEPFRAIGGNAMESEKGKKRK